MELITKYINKLGFNNELEQKSSDFGVLFHYETSYNNPVTKRNIAIPFLFFENTKNLFEYHLIEWNKNELDYFIAIEKDKSYIIKAKEKPDINAPLKKEVLIGEKGFDYGTNTEGYEDILKIPFSKENLNNSVFFDFVLQKQKEIKSEVDVHLLNNLIALKNELSRIDNNPENINGLILKCLFIKYLEDRNILPDISFVEILQRRNPKLLQDTFLAISIINGDILKKELIINEKHIEQLEIFFTCDYSQPVLFYPYKFNEIPIQLISNIYEEFLVTTDKKTKGIFYTRTFVVDFMLSHGVYAKIDKKENVTILDPACGSGAFLVQAFKQILSKPENIKKKIDEKAILLKKQIFGIDIDENALQITAFSLYLTLLQGIDKEAIKKQIEIKNPILPSLIGSNLLKKNTITENIEFDFVINLTDEHIKLSKFDCIVANPPWKQLEKKDADNDSEIKKTREAIDKNDIYKNVNKYQTSQAFLLKINELCNESSDVAIIVNNSIFLNIGDDKNTKPINFRKEILEKFRLTNFYELSDVAGILFKHTEHPCAVLILDKQNSENHKIKYITPKLTEFSRKLRVISYSQKDIKELNQHDLKEEDILWRIFINGNWKDYQLLKKIELKGDKDFSFSFCSGGIIYDGATPKGVPILRKRLKSKYLHQFLIEDDELEDYNINQIFERGRENNFNNLFTGSRILIKRQLTNSDKLRLVCAYTNNDYIFGQDVMSAKLTNSDFHKTVTGIINSSLIGYYFNQTASQSNRNNTIPAVKVVEIKNLPILKLNKDISNQLDTIIFQIIQREISNNKLFVLDELVFNLYGLLEFEKEIIREFYQINAEKKNKLVKIEDIQIYVDKFRETYKLVLKDNLVLNTSCVISTNIGTVVKFDLVNEKMFNRNIKQNDFDSRKVLQLVKEKQIQKEMLSGYINENKVKIYAEKSLYIVKSNQFKDWTKRQAMEDANEEIHEILNKLK